MTNKLESLRLKELLEREETNEKKLVEIILNEQRFRKEIFGFKSKN